MMTVQNLFLETARGFIESSPFLLLGLLFAGFLGKFIRFEKLLSRLDNKKGKSILWGALIGLPLPICSCGVVPVAISLKRKGLSKGGAASFLVATPETGADSIALTVALLGPFFAVYRAIAAFFSAIIVGFAVEAPFLKSKKTVSNSMTFKTLQSAGCDGNACCEAEKRTDKKTFKGFFIDSIRESAEILYEIGHWLILGFIAAALINEFAPREGLAAIQGKPLISMGLALLAGLPMYVCASSSTPVAAAMIGSGFSPGAALVFLMSGPATNLGSLLALKKEFGLPAIVRLLIALAGSCLVAGLIADQLFKSGLPGFGRQTQSSVSPAFTFIEMFCAGTLFLLLGNKWIVSARNFIIKPASSPPMEKSLQTESRG